MKVGEFFVEMQIKGAEKLQESLSGIGKGLKDVSEGALESQSLIDRLAKSSIGLGATFEELSRRGSKVGLTLANFHRYTQLNVRPAQEFARAMNQVGISTGQSLDAISSIQDEMAKIRMGKGAVGAFFGTLGINTRNINSPYQVLELLHHFIRTNPEKFTPDIVNQIVGETGLSRDMIAAMRSEKNIFPHLGAGQYLTNGQIAKDAAIAGQWATLQTDLENFAAKASALFGPTLVHTLDQFTLALNRFIDATIGFSEKHPVAKNAIEQGAATTAIAGGGAGIGMAAGALGIGGLTVASGGAVGFLALGAAAAAWFAEHDSGMLSKDKFGRIFSGISDEAKQLMAEIHITVPAASETKKTHIRRQSASLHDTKSTAAQHSSLQSPARNGGNF